MVRQRERTPSLHSKPVIFLVDARDEKKLHEGDSSTGDRHNSSGGGSDFHSFKNHCFKTDGVPSRTELTRRSWPNFDLSYVLRMPLQQRLLQ